MAHKLRDNALIDFETFLSFIGESEDGTQMSKDKINLYINMASKVIEDYCDRLFRSAVGTVELFDGDGDKDYYTRNVPIDETTTSIKLECWNGVAFEEITSSQATRATQTDRGRVYFTDGTKFNEGEDNWRITYDSGVDREDIPSDLQQACCILVQRVMLKAEGKEGVASESLIDRSVTIDLSSIPRDVQRILDSNRNVAYGR